MLATSAVTNVSFARSGREFNTLVILDFAALETMARISQWVLFTVVCQLIVLFGIGTNIVNIICFIKQTFKDTVNISLFALATADIGCLASLVWTNICFTPAFSEADLPFEPIELQYLIGGMPHITFTRISAWITAIIALERCLCIIAPLKVKSIVTPKRVAILNICLYIVLLSSVTPLYIVNRLDMKFVPFRNKTILGLVFTANRDQVEKFSYAINSSLIPMTAFLVITISTIALVIKLHKAAKWRHNSTSGEQKDTVTQRNQKVARMVVMISVLFIGCFIPFSILFVGMSVEPELSLNGKYRSILVTAAGFCTTLESINSSANVFIYYRMSSKYRSILKDLFSKTKSA